MSYLSLLYRIPASVQQHIIGGYERRGVVQKQKYWAIFLSLSFYRILRSRLHRGQIHHDGTATALQIEWQSAECLASHTDDTVSIYE